MITGDDIGIFFLGGRRVAAFAIIETRAIIGDIIGNFRDPRRYWDIL